MKTCCPKACLLAVALLLCLNFYGNFKRDSLENIISLNESHTAVTEAWIELAAIYLNDSPSSSDSIALLAIENAKSLSDKELMARALKACGNAQLYLGNFEEALASYQSIQDLLQGNKSETLAQTLNNIGLVYDLQGLYPEAIQQYTKALELSLEIDYKKGIADANNNLGIVHYFKGELLKSIQFYHNSLEIEQAIGNEIGQGATLLNIGNIHYELKEYELAEEALDHASIIFKKHGNHRDLGSAYNNLGTIRLLKENASEALRYFEKALESNKRTDNKTELALTYYNLGLAQATFGNFSLALGYYLQSVDLCEHHNNKQQLCLSYKNIGKLHLDQGDLNLAEGYLKKAMSLADELHLKAEQYKCYKHLATVYAKQNKHKLAFEYHSLFESLKDSVTSLEKYKQIQDLEARYQAAKKEQEINNLSHDNKIQAMELRQSKMKLISLLSSMLILILSFGLFYRNRKLRNKSAIATMKQSILRLQMNPHFIFNSLTSIQNFILKKDTLEANTHLASFSKLMRQTLEFSRKEFISITEEIELLEAYLKLQKARLPNKFNYEIHCDEALDDSTAIPPMLAQPFVENAIEHGIIPLNNLSGRVVVHFYKSQEKLCIEVTDNGVGLKNSQKINGAPHKSRAIEITTERLKLLNKSSCSLNMKELQQGTLIKICLPIHYM